MDDLVLVQVDDYKQLLKERALLKSIREGKDYAWLKDSYDYIDAYIDGMSSFQVEDPTRG